MHCSTPTLMEIFIKSLFALASLFQQGCFWGHRNCLGLKLALLRKCSNLASLWFKQQVPVIFLADQLQGSVCLSAFMCVCGCVSVKRVCTNLCVCVLMCSMLPLHLEKTQKYTAASRDKQEQIRLCGSPSPTPMGCSAFVYQPSWRCYIWRKKKHKKYKEVVQTFHFFTQENQVWEEKKIWLVRFWVHWINRTATWPFRFSILLLKPEGEAWDFHRTFKQHG